MLLQIEEGRYSTKLEYSGSPAKRRAYREDEARLLREFRADLEKEFSMTDHPKAFLLWEIAWREGHSEGLASVYRWYDELSVLVI